MPSLENSREKEKEGERDNIIWKDDQVTQETKSANLVRDSRLENLVHQRLSVQIMNELAESQVYIWMSDVYQHFGMPLQI